MFSTFLRRPTTVAEEGKALGNVHRYLRGSERARRSTSSAPPAISQASAATRCLLTVSRPKPSSRPISM